MVANVGTIDRILRVVIGAILIVLPFVVSTSFLQSTVVQVVLPIVGAVLIATALVRFCPLYRLMGASTCQTQAH